MNFKILSLVVAISFLSACTTGKLYYTDNAGQRVLGCNVEFVGLPSVDKFAVEYALSHCARSAAKKGHQLDPEQAYLLDIDTTIPAAPCGQSWNHDLVRDQYNRGLLTKKEYGYIVAHIDLGLAVVEECLPDNTDNRQSTDQGSESLNLRHGNF